MFKVYTYDFYGPSLFNFFSKSTNYFVSAACTVVKNVLVGLLYVELKDYFYPDYSF